MPSGRTYSIVGAVLIAGTALLSSCDNSELPVRELQMRELPSLTARDVETMYSDSGKVTLLVQTPYIQQFSNEEQPYTLFPEGLMVLFYDKKTEPQASITAQYARYTEKDELWELRDSVVAVNTEGDILETELLFWSEPKASVWSDRFVRITGKDQIIMGTGFESDPRLSKWKIKNVSATIYVENEQKVTPAD
ncbi:MAG: LPS export ABC transporter periplasmic protein LptC [Bacteroidales bacterium]|nr:LPS export ABC transporter periplasmic protein LptC [Bacteroidales bacterium]MDT8374879.1 LPS export ABC transporter periplasmic protein LptC [Bacteroidales bacterium]